MAKSIVGVVSSDKTDKTIVVTVHTRKTHPLYRKQYMVTSKFMAHDEKNAAKTGDKVIITETRPISARKSERFGPFVRIYLRCKVCAVNGLAKFLTHLF